MSGDKLETVQGNGNRGAEEQESGKITKKKEETPNWAELPQVKGDVSEMMRGYISSRGGAVRRSSKRRESCKSSRRWGKQ